MIVYSQDASIRKLDPDASDADKEGYIEFIPNLKVNIQPAGPEYTAEDLLHGQELKKI